MANIDSSAIRGDYLKDIMDKTIGDIHDTMTTLYGPYAVDAYIFKDGRPYYTRDGMEVLSHMKYDVPIANSILTMLHQAAYNQAVTVGDGTTTLVLFYTNLYNRIRKSNISTYPITTIRSKLKSVISLFNDSLKRSSVSMTETRMKDLIYTSTQDLELTELICEKLGSAMQENAYIIFNQACMDDQLEVVVHEEPLLNVEKIYSTFTVKTDGSDIPNTQIFFIDGQLDISDVNTFTSLCCDASIPEPRNILFLCASTSETTRNTINKFQSIVSQDLSSGRAGKYRNNIIIGKMLDFRSYNEDIKTDLISLLYGTLGLGGETKDITFESMLHKAFNIVNEDGKPIERLQMFDAAPECLDTLRCTISDLVTINMVPGKGLKINKPMTALAKKRYEDLIKSIDEEKSPIPKSSLQKRLRAIYGKFIEIRVGSTLLKDSQRTYELILDSVKSTMDSYKNGAVEGNSMVIALIESEKYLAKSMDDKNINIGYIENLLYSLIREALLDTLADLHRVSSESIANKISKISSSDDTDYNKHNKLHIDMHIEFPEDMTGKIVEPISTLTTILNNCTLSFELALAQLFNVETMMRNYI